MILTLLSWLIQMLMLICWFNVLFFVEMFKIFSNGYSGEYILLCYVSTDILFSGVCHCAVMLLIWTVMVYVEFLHSANYRSMLLLCCWYELWWCMLSFYIEPITVASLTVIEQYFTFHIARIAHKGNYIKCHIQVAQQRNKIYPGKGGGWARATTGLLERKKCYSEPVKKTWGAIMYWYWFCERLGKGILADIPPKYEIKRDPQILNKVSANNFCHKIQFCPCVFSK